RGSGYGMAELPRSAAAGFSGILPDRPAANRNATLCRSRGIAPNCRRHTPEPNRRMDRVGQRPGFAEEVSGRTRHLLDSATKGTPECSNPAASREGARVFEPSRRSDRKLSHSHPTESGRWALAL